MDPQDDLPILNEVIPEVVVPEHELEKIWQAALGEIEVSVSHPNFVTWFKNSRFIERRGNTAYISLANNFAKEWIENKYPKVVLAALRRLEENIIKVEFSVHHSKTSPVARRRLSGGSEEESSQMAFPEMKVDAESNLNPRYTLGSFIVGKSNELSYAAATSIIDDIGRKYNPLFIYGGTGLGKTHLMQAVGNEIRTKYQNKVKVKYVSSEKFTNDVIWAIRNKRMETVKEKYRFIDVLIIDDIQFIIGKAATEEEFFHTFNALHENNKQIIISSDRPPKFMPNLEERLRSRFEGGMITDIGYPDYELRCAVLKTKLSERGIQLTDEVVGMIASKIQKNMRELEGILNKILFYQKQKNIQITPALAEEIIGEIIQEPMKNISPNAVIKSVADSFEISINDLISQSRKRELVGPRQIAMYLLRDILDLSYPNIGERMGKRDHTTALYAFEKIATEIHKNQALNQKISNIKELITKL
ncbi:MAG: chromosomal replication initiator protein DnaA [Janthinobacterium sp.]|jgi:chromosomal replication initiator protein